MRMFRYLKQEITPTQILPIGFLTIILIGTFLLMLPISTKSGSLSFLNALFTATSATCVTGLVVVDTGTYFTTFGQVVILGMIQFGGLGFMTVATFLFIAVGKKISLKERMLMAESMGETQLHGILRLALNVLKLTFTIELIGACVLALVFIPIYNFSTGIWYAIFHSISAFCNAGFDLIGNYASFTGFVTNPLLCFTIIALIVTGGLGFGVVIDLRDYHKYKKLRLHSKLVLIVTGILLVGGTILFLTFEYNNPNTMGDLNFFQKLMAALFQSVTTRTAGFNTIDQLQMTDASKLITIILMFIGGAPAGTAGGIKITTIAVLVLVVRALIKNHTDIEIFGRRLNRSVFSKALAMFLIGLTSLLVAVVIVSINETGTVVGDTGFLNQFFEVTSALGTVGLSTGVTVASSQLTRIVLCILMFMGRVGLLTIAFALGSNAEKSVIRYPEEDILIG